MESIFSSLIAKMDDAITKTAGLAADVGVPASTTDSILMGVSKRAKIIGK